MCLEALGQYLVLLWCHKFSIAICFNLLKTAVMPANGLLPHLCFTFSCEAWGQRGCTNHTRTEHWLDVFDRLIGSIHVYYNIHILRLRRRFPQCCQWCSGRDDTRERREDHRQPPATGQRGRGLGERHTHLHLIDVGHVTGKMSEHLIRTQTLSANI